MISYVISGVLFVGGVSLICGMMDYKNELWKDVD